MDFPRIWSQCMLGFCLSSGLSGKDHVLGDGSISDEARTQHLEAFPSAQNAGGSQAMRLDLGGLSGYAATQGASHLLLSFNHEAICQVGADDEIMR